MASIKLKGRAAGNFFAAMMVENHGEDALKKCAEGSPMYSAVKEILESNKLNSKSVAQSEK